MSTTSNATITLPALLFAALASLGCGDRSTPLDANDSDGGVVGKQDAAANNCARTCSGCAIDEQCIGGDPTDEYGAVCRKRCTTTDDCSSGEHCVSVLNLASDPHTAHVKTDGPVCVTDAAPARCQATIGGYHCDPQQGYCSDPHVAVNPFPSSNFTCGVEHTNCPNGCEVVLPDGGVFGAVARCK
jgi:hypothetical protein